MPGRIFNPAIRCAAQKKAQRSLAASSFSFKASEELSMTRARPTIPSSSFVSPKRRMSHSKHDSTGLLGILPIAHHLGGHPTRSKQIRALTGSSMSGTLQDTSTSQLGDAISLQGNGRYIRIVEVSARDGLQNLSSTVVDTKIKKELIERLVDAGVRNVEVGSFVRAKKVPQMADTPQLLPLLDREPATAIVLPKPRSRSSSPISGLPSDPVSISIPLPEGADILHYPVLVPNAKGLENLLKLEEEWKARGRTGRLTDEISVFVSATEEFSLRNNDASVQEVLSVLPKVIAKAIDEGYRVRGYVSCVMTDPYSGETSPAKVVDVAEKLLEYGCYEISLGDTTGEGNPEAWRLLWNEVESRGLPVSKIAAHCHDTFSMALTSIVSLLPRGLSTIDSSLAGLGGCPYSPGATGNVPTEDVVYALHKLGYQTGIDLDKLVEAGNWLTETLGIRNESRVGRAIWARRMARESEAGIETYR